MISVQTRLQRMATVSRRPMLAMPWWVEMASEPNEAMVVRALKKTAFDVLDRLMV